MLKPHIIAVTAHSLAVRCAVPGARYWHERPLAWELHGDGQVRAGSTRQVVLSLHDLKTDYNYELLVDGFAPIRAHTRPCVDVISIDKFGAHPALPDNAEIIQRALDALPVGGTLRIPPGVWSSGPLFLKSDMELFLADGATLRARNRDDAWPILPGYADGAMLGSWEGRPDACHAALVTAIGAERLMISGAGVLDGGGADSDWWTWAKGKRRDARRARTVHLINCTDVTLLGPIIQNSPSWTVHPQGCKRLIAAALHIKAPDDSPNTDGLNPESCEDVQIEGVRFAVGDDCIAIKAGKRAKSDNDHLAHTRNVVVRHCLMEAGHGGVVIGSEMSGGVSDVTISDCEMHGTDRGLRLKTRRGRGGYIRKVTMQDVTMTRVAVPFCANAFYFCDEDGHDDWVQSRNAVPVDETTPEISEISIMRVTVSDLGAALGAFLGLPEQPIKNVDIRDVQVTSYDLHAQAAAPIMADEVRAMRHEGICCEYTDLKTDDLAQLSTAKLTIRAEKVTG